VTYPGPFLILVNEERRRGKGGGGGKGKLVARAGKPIFCFNSRLRIRGEKKKGGRGKKKGEEEN